MSESADPAETRRNFDPLPSRIAALPVDARGYPVPWFVDWITTETGDWVPEFRAMDPTKWRAAIRHRLCWVCGQVLGRYLAFSIGPMCAINRVTTEPPAHRDCAEWSVRNCPFLSTPQMVRRTEGLPADAASPGGIALLRNPGVVCLWITRGYEVVPDGQGGRLITVGEPIEVTWWRARRVATRAEVEEAIATGMPILLASARTEGPFAVEALGKMADRALRWYPAA